MKIIAIEEHWISEEFQRYYPKAGSVGYDADIAVLTDIGERRIAVMDQHGIDMQVLGHGMFPVTTVSVEQVMKTNDQAAAAVERYPDRFAAFAALPLANIGAAVEELARTVTQFGFKGTMINGTVEGKFLDHPDFWPLLAKAEELGVPIYLHPAYPVAAVSKPYYDGNFSDLVSFTLGSTAAGWHWETGLHVLRMIVSGIFDKFPRLQIIIGHLGELIPFYWERIEYWLEPRVENLRKPVREYFRSNIHITTSGYSTQAPFQLALQTFGLERLIFSVDYPFNPLAPAISFLHNLPLTQEQKAQVAGLNVARLLRL
ncbi:amidohydrolase family protein [Serratia sp. Tan611]|uniref:amidohydrolase family protein n=1 Tax=Serratia sp. Tan611 TaxID=2773264 RepID=UPI001934B63D|nr:amidohydrolase family protein [Serratia sp. Tan611]MBU3895139.1 amidohydrolase family protein [Serratia rubidaea]CAE1147414.1 Predicted metal-dependent hydrolase of the TIM-barrel fold [Serratia sp. Tan611]